MAANRVIRFDGWTLHCDTGELSRDGAQRRLQSQSLAVLEMLLARPGEMVSREELIARLWPRGVVDFDTALNTAVRRVRTALGDHADHPRYIETIPKRGYRFIGRLEPDAFSSPSPAEEERVGVREAEPSPGLRPTSPAHGRGEEAPSRAQRETVGVREALPGPPKMKVGVRAILLTLLAVGLMAGLVVWPAWRANEVRPQAAAPAAPTETVPAAAVDAYRQARFLLQRRGPGDVANARERFEKALQLHPRHARAWAGIASTWWLDVAEGRVAPDEGLPAARQAALRALELDPRIAEAHLRLANVAWSSGDRRSGDTHLRAALALEPDDPLVASFAASTAIGRGDWTTAVALQRRAVEADPLAGAARHNLAVFLYLAGRYEEAIAQLQELRALVPNDEEVLALLGATHVLAGGFEEALGIADQLTDAVFAAQIRAMALHALGRRDESNRAVQALTALAARKRPDLLAEVHAYRGETDAAFEWLAVAADPEASECAAQLCNALDWLKWSPFLRPLTTDGRWQRWLAQLRNMSTNPAAA
jgi:DNA-binding winged helix-turn-helix (wHTH) protein/tetratricopeptide (TPR) repeat protein